MQDISAIVDFTAVAQAGAAANLMLLGNTSQAQFTLSGDIERLLARAQSEREYLRMAQQLKRLTLPSEMGERFQVMALGRNIELPMAEFVRRDFRGRL
ncbi:MAG TPA: hypothetical protein VHJ19_08690 [Gammaproteobacteria bacterium]|nr:hypothetical protein [Gammaproteobacteria bacterium]